MPPPTSRLVLRCLLAGFAISLIGGAILFTPTLEFAAVDLIERLGLPIGPIGNIAVIGEALLFGVCALGLIVMAGRRLFARKPG